VEVIRADQRRRAKDKLDAMLVRREVLERAQAGSHDEAGCPQEKLQEMIHAVTQRSACLRRRTTRRIIL
jgi:hypothetical protein